MKTCLRCHRCRTVRDYPGYVQCDAGVFPMRPVDNNFDELDNLDLWVRRDNCPGYEFDRAISKLPRVKLPPKPPRPKRIPKPPKPPKLPKTCRWCGKPLERNEICKSCKKFYLQKYYFGITKEKRRREKRLCLPN